MCVGPIARLSGFRVGFGGQNPSLATSGFSGFRACSGFGRKSDGGNDLHDSVQTSSVTMTPSEQEKSVTVGRYLLAVTLFVNMGFTKTVTVSGVSL